MKKWLLKEWPTLVAALIWLSTMLYLWISNMGA